MEDLNLVYKGAHTNKFYTAYYDGATWHGNTKISAQPGGISPASNLNPGVTVTSAIPDTRARWMANLSGSLAISEINIPGTHDSAAINTWSPVVIYACHNISITKQLEYGIRLLDVRLKVSQSGSTYTFVTCHGKLPGSTYQDFPSLMEECKQFLLSYPKEVILMCLKMDNWNGLEGNKVAVIAALQSLLTAYPISSTTPSMVNLGAVRGKVVLFNRLSSNKLGVPIGWPDNTSGIYKAPTVARSWGLYAQDQWEGLPLVHPTAKKTELVTAAFGQKKAGEVVWNFASATWYAALGVYVMPNLLNYFGEKTGPNRPVTFGWTLFDYAFNKYTTDTYGPLDVVTIIIESNCAYLGYDKKFRVEGNGEL